MHGVSPDLLDEDTNSEVYFEFDFFDGIMVDCKKVNCTELNPRAQGSNENRLNSSRESEAPRLSKAGAGNDTFRVKQGDLSRVVVGDKMIRFSDLNDTSTGSRETSFSACNGPTIGSEWARLCATVMDNQIMSQNGANIDNSRCHHSEQNKYIDYRRSSFSDYNDYTLNNQRARFSKQDGVVIDHQRDARHVAMMDDRRASFSDQIGSSRRAGFLNVAMTDFRKNSLSNDNEAMTNQRTAFFPGQTWGIADNWRANLMNHSTGTATIAKMVTPSGLLMQSETDDRNTKVKGKEKDQNFIDCKESIEWCRKSVDSVKDDIQFSFLGGDGNLGEQQPYAMSSRHSLERTLSYNLPGVSMDASCGHDVDLSVKNSEQSYGHSTRDLSSGHFDWLWCEEAPANHVTSQIAQSVAPPPSTVNTPNADEVCNMMGDISLGEKAETSITEHSYSVGNGNLKPLDPEESPRCSSMSLTDLIEVASPGDNIRELTHQAVLNLRNSLSNAVPSNEVKDTSSHSMTNSKCTSRRNSTGSRPDAKMLSLVEPSSYSTVHGLLHVNSREGLPNYTFLLDEYDEIIVAKIWTEDVILGEDQGNWRYSFYSLRGNSKKKARSGWKHWGRKEKLASVLVGKMRVSSMVLPEKTSDGETRLSVQSEFVLSGPKFQEPELSPQMTLLSSPGNSPRICNRAGSKAFTSSSSPSQSHTSSSSGGQSAGVSPSDISAWYVSQSLIPYTSSETKQKSSKWSFWKAKKMKPQSSSFLAFNSCLNSEYSEDHVNYSVGHSELAAMVINVPLEIHDSLTMENGKTNVNHSIDLRTYPIAECENQACDHRRHKRNREASITVILPCGSHGKPVMDTKGPSPLINRWKEGGQCDCKGWDLGCGITVLNNKKQKTESSRSREFKSKVYQLHDKKLVLYKEDGDYEDAILNLSPHENGLIAVDFCGLLSPLQAFAIAVGILHGRASNSSNALKCDSLPEMECRHKNIPVTEACGVVEPDGVTLGLLMARESESKMLTSYIQASNLGLSNIANDNSTQSSVKVQALNCASGPALSFDRL